MSTMFTRTGAELRALAAANNAEAIAEIARRAAKPAKTVAALRSRGDNAAADARVKAAKAAKPAPKAPAPVITPVKPVPNREEKAVAFTRTHEVVANPKGAIAHLHNRMCAVEAAVTALAQTQAQTAEILKRLTA